MNRVCKIERRTEFIVVGAACFQPVFEAELTAAMFATYFDRLGPFASEYSDQMLVACSLESFIKFAFGCDPEVFDPQIPSWMLCKLSEDFLQEDGTLPFATYHDLVDAIPSTINPVPTLLDAYRMWKEQAFVVPASA